MVKVQWGKKVPSFNPYGAPMKAPDGRTYKSSQYGIQERYIQSVYTSDAGGPDDPNNMLAGAKQVGSAVSSAGRAVTGDQPENGITLEALAAKVDAIEAAVWQLAQQALGGGGEPEPEPADDEASPNRFPAPTQPRSTMPGMDRRTTGDGFAKYLNQGHGDAMTARRTGSRMVLSAINEANRKLRR